MYTVKSKGCVMAQPRVYRHCYYSVTRDLLLYCTNVYVTIHQNKYVTIGAPRIIANTIPVSAVAILVNFNIAKL